jgi:hypothetical protein
VKRVRYLAGAAGLAPAAFGMVTMPAAVGAVTPQAGTGHGKTVSVGHARVNTGCTGGTVHYLASHPDTNLYGHFWYTQHGSKTCIGTLVLSVIYNKTICKTAGASERSPGGSGWTQSTGNYCGNKNTTYMWSFGVHKSIKGPVSVCVGSTYGGPNCTTVP